MSDRCPTCGSSNVSDFYVCPWCKGEGVLPGKNWVAQGYVEPNCYHCNGQKRALLPCDDEWHFLDVEAEGGESRMDDGPTPVESASASTTPKEDEAA